MAQPTPLNDPATYQKISADAYAKRTSAQMRNPKQVIADRENEADGKASMQAAPAPAPASPTMSQATFSGYSGDPKAAAAAKQAALAKVLSDRAAKDKESSSQPSGE